MARYTPESRDRVRDAVDFVELVGAKTELRRAGAQRWQGLCPFHEERTPSFGIDPVEKLYHCFGCGVGGDVFAFVMETEGLDFTAALESLADRTGIELERVTEDPREAERRVRRERLLALLERTTAYYVRMLWESTEAAAGREYLLGRGLEEAVLRDFRVGFAPSAWDRVLLASRRAGFSEEELQAAGLAVRGRSGGVYDRFRSRLMFPLADARGRVLGFGARALRDNQQPKYLNSSDGEVYRKGLHVYGHDLARAAAARSSAVVLAEGYTDVIALRQAGIANVVGLMGTALTAEQADKLKQLAPSVSLCLDADSAGQEAMVRAAALLRGGRRELRVVPLPSGSDPADIVAAEGAGAARALLGRAVPFERFLVERALDRGALDSAEGRDRVLSEAAEVIRPMPASVQREELERLVAGRLGLSEALAAAALGAAGAARGGAGARPVRENGTHTPARGGGALDRREQTERSFLALCLGLPDEGERRLAAADLDALFASPLNREAAAYLRTHLRQPAAALSEAGPEVSGLIAELVLRAGEAEVTPGTIEVEALQLELARLDREIAGARERGTAVLELAKEHQRVHEAIRRRLT